MSTPSFSCCIVCLFLAVTCLASSQTASSAPASPTPALQNRNPIYRVAPSDVLAVSFPLSPELNQSVTVQPDGFITLANVGSVYVQGLTAPEIVETLRKSLSKILHDPIIAVDFTNFQSAQFTIFGQVAKPGQYPLRYDTTVSQAIAIGGGFAGGAKNQAFLLRRVSFDLLEVKKLDVKAFVHGKNLSEDVQLQAGDMIYVPESFIGKLRKFLPYSTGIGVSPLAIAQAY
ncbi:MAG: polysaccharide biosynthesis/export family protein [Candidatus Sulfotelmatobacter sp.]